MLYLYARYIAEQELEDAVDSNIYVCGMQPIGEDNLCHDIFQCDPDLTCTLPVEADFYTCKRPSMAFD